MAEIATNLVYKLPLGYPKVPLWVTDNIEGMEKEITEWLEENDKKQRIATNIGARALPKQRELPNTKTTFIEVEDKKRQEDVVKHLAKRESNKPTISKKPELPKKKVSFSNIVNLKCISCGAETNRERKFGKCACKEWEAEVTTTKKPVTRDDYKSTNKNVMAKIETSQKIQRKEEVRVIMREEIERSFKDVRRNITPKVELSKKLQRPGLFAFKPLRFSGPVSLNIGKETKFFPNGVMVMPLQV